MKEEIRMDSKFNQKIEAIAKLLQELSNEHNVHYSFNYVLLSESKNILLKTDMLYNSSIIPEALRCMLIDSNKVLNKMLTARKLASRGAMVFEFEKGLKNNIEEIRKGDFVTLESISYDNLSPTYTLTGVKTPMKYDSKQITLLQSFSIN